MKDTVSYVEREKQVSFNVDMFWLIEWWKAFVMSDT